MKQSQLFTRTRREAPKDEESKNAQLLIRAGYIHKEMAGAYAYLPLGLRVIEKIKTIVREEMNALDGQEIVMTALQRKELWAKTDRWGDNNVDVWFKSEFKSGAELGFAWSHEEPITDMMKFFISSYRDLPSCVYQFQTKFRNELRAKSGILRGREFMMKDMYSYSADDEAHQAFYNKAIGAYHRVFERVGLGGRTYFNFASGGAFTQFSHEFQTVSDAGEDTIYLDRKKKIAINKEVLTEEVMKQLEVRRDDLEEQKSIEVGNIFSFGSVKSEQLGLYFKDDKGNSHPVILGSYGIGITRLMGALVEVFSDEKGIVWPEAVAPYRVHLLLLGKEFLEKERADKLYTDLQSQRIEVLYDDRRDVSAGEKLADADLIGVPWRLVISERTAEKIEAKRRSEKEARLVNEDELLPLLQR